MDITRTMLQAARHAEFLYYQRNRGPNDRFRPLSDSLIREIVAAAISAIGIPDEPEPAPPAEPDDEEPVPPPRAPKTVIVRARKPRPRR